MPEEEKEGKEEEDWLSRPEFLLPRFNTLHSLVKEQVKHNDVNKARGNYNRMLQMYNEISKSKLSGSEKQESYKKLAEAFNTISNPPAGAAGISVPLAKYLFPISVIVIILVIIFFIKPELALTGLHAFSPNSAPEFEGDAQFIVQGKTEVNLDNHFTDPDGDKLTYLVTEAPNIDVSVSGSILTINPQLNLKGLRMITVIASDLKENTKVDVKLNIK
jgi:hypothetical protein